MTRTRALVCAVVVVAVGPAAAADDPLASLFPLRAAITADGGGLRRLELPAEVLGRCRPDLADLRIVGADGREIPYVVDSPEVEGATELSYAVAPVVLEAERSQEEVGDRVTVFRERYLLELPPLPRGVPAWEVEVRADRREFVSRLDVALVGPAGERTPVITDGSLFRLPSVGAERLEFAIPGDGGGRLEVVLAGEGPGYLAPHFALRAGRVLWRGSASSVRFEVLELRQLPGVTELVLDRPRGLAPRRFQVTTSTGTFHRKVTVWDEGPGADPEPLGRGEILRVAALAPVEVLEVVVRPPRGDRLRVVVENRDSPPLDDLAVAAILPRPVLVFSLPEGAPGATLLFGGGRAQRPDYDLAALDPGGRLPVTGEAARRALALLDPANAGPAALGQVMANPGWDPAPALAFAMHPGAEVDPRPFRYRRQLAVNPSPEGLSLLPLEPADLAVLRPDLADLRVVDGEGRQWAYLRQDRARTVTVPLRVAGHERDGRVSIYALEVPDGPLAVGRVELEAEAPYFDRDFVLRGRLEDGSERELARGRLVRRAGDPRPITVAVEPRRVTRLELHVSDGDDAPLVLPRVSADAAAPDLYLAAVAGEYELLLGDPDAEAPVYELERVRSTILAVPAVDVTAGELEANPAFSAAGRLARSGAWQKILLWVVLGLAVVVLAAVTLRAARS
ncbi:MAG TPA: hypothetical protein VLB51_09665 [Methylomirabilota bacterium]|nr:hypothetical protein [Methylomirabilota bacterium]